MQTQNMNDCIILSLLYRNKSRKLWGYWTKFLSLVEGVNAGVAIHQSIVECQCRE